MKLAFKSFDVKLVSILSLVVFVCDTVEDVDVDVEVEDDEFEDVDDASEETDMMLFKIRLFTLVELPTIEFKLFERLFGNDDDNGVF